MVDLLSDSTHWKCDLDNHEWKRPKYDVHAITYQSQPARKSPGVSVPVTQSYRLTSTLVCQVFNSAHVNICGPNWKYQFRKEAVDMWPNYLYLNSVGLQLIEIAKYLIQLLEARSSTTCNRNVGQWKISWEPYFAQISVFVNVCNGCRNPGSRGLS